MKNYPTTATIAKTANVSRATVYAVLNSPKQTNIRVREETRQQVMDVAERLGYVHNKTASGLKSGKYYSIAVVAQSIANVQFSRFFSAFDDLACANGYFTFLSGSEGSFERERNKLNAILQQGVDALVVGLLHPAHNHDVLEKFYARNIPVVILGNDAGKNTAADLIGFDEVYGARLISDYIKSAGHCRVAYLQLLGKEDYCGSYFDARGHYLQQAFAEDMPNIELHYFTSPTIGGPETGAHFMQKMRETYGGNLPTAIICSNDMLASDMISVLEKNGIIVPEHISVIGYDNLNKANSMLAPITSLDLPFEQLGMMCWQRLEQRFENAASGDYRPGPTITITPELIVRSSSKDINH